MTYQPGSHIIASLESEIPARILAYSDFKTHIQTVIESNQLEKLGEVYHNFPGGGFTAVICLSESHISIHTWPEHKLVNVDIYLSNFKRTNDGTVKEVFNGLITFFEARVRSEQIIIR
jgi:S-adenosylmethionine decarboxylase